MIYNKYSQTTSNFAIFQGVECNEANGKKVISLFFRGLKANKLLIKAMLWPARSLPPPPWLHPGPADRLHPPANAGRSTHPSERLAGEQTRSPIRQWIGCSNPQGPLDPSTSPTALSGSSPLPSSLDLFRSIWVSSLLRSIKSHSLFSYREVPDEVYQCLDAVGDGEKWWEVRWFLWFLFWASYQQWFLVLLLFLVFL